MVKNFSYSFSNSDVETLILTLDTFLNTDLNGTEFESSSIQQDINIKCCGSALEKLLNKRTDFFPNELRIMLASLLLAQNIFNGAMVVDNEVKQTLAPHVFSVNHLLKAFSPLLD